MTRCPQCGRHDDMAAELRALLAIARRRSTTTIYGQACVSMVPYYERALAALDEGAAIWAEMLRAIGRAPALRSDDLLPDDPRDED